jgi:hypothetical protein
MRPRPLLNQASLLFYRSIRLCQFFFLLCLAGKAFPGKQISDMRRGCMLLALCVVTLSITADVCTSRSSPLESRIPSRLCRGCGTPRAKEGSGAIRRSDALPTRHGALPAMLRLRGGSPIDCTSLFRKWWNAGGKLGGWRGPRREKEVLEAPSLPRCLEIICKTS